MWRIPIALPPSRVYFSQQKAELRAGHSASVASSNRGEAVTDIFRHRVRWTGIPGSTGISNFYFLAPGQNPALRTLFNSWATFTPSSVKFKFDPIIAKLDASTGQLNGQDSGGTAIDLSGGASSAYSAAAGAMVNWDTLDFVNGRQVHGRTFLVPFASLENDGTLTSASVTQVSNAVAAFVLATIGQYVIWRRPNPPAAGSVHVVVNGRIQDKSFVLRSRRD